MTDAPTPTRKLHVLSGHQTRLSVVDDGTTTTALHALSDHTTDLHVIEWGE